MYSLKDAILPGKEQEYILSRVSEEDIFRQYCSNFKKIGKVFCSELREDKNPSCVIDSSGSGPLKYKDWGRTDRSINCFNYIMLKYNCTFVEALNIVLNDFKLIISTSTIEPRLTIGRDINSLERFKTRTMINIQEQSFTLTDFNYWKQFNIDLPLLQEYNVFSCKAVFFYKGDKKFIIQYKDTNPVYAYRFTREGQYFYKIYRPLGPKSEKFLWNGSSSDIEGHDQLELTAEVLILTKSLKDVICIRSLGFNAISLQGESNKLSHEDYTKLYSRFGRIISLYDADAQGFKGADELFKTYNIKPYFIPAEYTSKDISEFIRDYGTEEAKNLIEEMLEP